MDTNDKELFEAAMTDDAEIETPVEPVVEDQGQPRDEHGRFAAKQPDTEGGSTDNPVGHEQQGMNAEHRAGEARDPAHVPSWRLREVREEADRRVAAAEAAAEARWQRQLAELQRQNQPKAEPKPAPDPFENPNGFLEHGVSQAVDPIKAEVQQTREYFSRMMAEDKHGADKVRAAYDWLGKGIAERDPEAIAAYQRAMQSMHPYGEMVKAHEQRTVYQQIGNDPQAWFGKTLEERLSDPKFAGELLQKLQQSTRSNPQAQSQVNLPPSLRNTPSARSATDDDGDGSDAAMFRYAMR